MQEQGLTAGGRQGKRNYEVKKSIKKPADDTRERRERDAGDKARTMIPRLHLPQKHKDINRHWEVMEWMRKVPGRQDSTERRETEMEVKKTGY